MVGLYLTCLCILSLSRTSDFYRAHGHEVYGPQYHDALRDLIRRPAEACDSLQSFFAIHSLGGGTGSGLGTYILRMLKEEYPEVYRFAAVVFPSKDDDVITSPYNSVLSVRELCEYADCVLPVENQALMDIVQLARNTSGKTVRASITGSASSSAAPPPLISAPSIGSADSTKPFDAMNNIAAHLLCNLTWSARNFDWLFCRFLT